MEPVYKMNFNEKKINRKSSFFRNETSGFMTYKSVDYVFLDL